MATVQSHQQRSPVQRASVGPNILSRMLQLEKQSKQRRSHAPELPSVDFEKTIAFTSPTTLTPDASPAKLAPSTGRVAPNNSFSRSQTMPVLTQDMKLTEKRSLDLKTPEKIKPPLKIDPTAVKDWDAATARSEICLSPSWSDHGEKEKKKARKLKEKEKKRREEERKEAEKKMRKEEERQKAAAAKASKRDGRLSKRPPPAAMDTQRMPSELRRNSTSTKSGQNSQENSRPPSREWRRLSGISLGSNRSQSRSQSTPPTSTEIDGTAAEEWQPVVSAAAPQLPALHGFGWHSRNGSSGGSKSNSWGSDASYSRELARFTKRLSRSSSGISPQQASFDDTSKHVSPGLAPPAPLVRSQTNNDIVNVTSDSPVVKVVAQVLAERRNSKDAPGQNLRNFEMQFQQPATNGHIHEAPKTIQDQENRQVEPTPNLPRSSYRRERKLPLNPLQMNPTGRSSVDGSSYVHRQRMYQQQRSLAGFQDEEAVRDANRRLNEEAISSPEDGNVQQPVESEVTREEPKPAIPEKDLQIKSTISRDEAQSPQHISPREEPSDPYHSFIKASNGVQVEPKNQQPATSKMDRILGFGRRPKPSSQPSTKTNRSVGSDGSDTIVPSQLPSLEIPRQEEQIVQPSKAERMFGEPPPSSASPQTPKARSKLSQAIVDKEISPKSKDRPAIPRARTSQVTPIPKTSPPREQEVKPVQAQSRISQAAVSTSPVLEEAPLIRSHSRTRTSSSQLLNDNISISRPIVRSTTAPMLPAISLQPFEASHDQGTAELPRKPTSPTPSDSTQSFSTAYSRNPLIKGPRSPTESKPRSPKKSSPPPSPKNPSAPQNNSSTQPPKPLPEVIVETANSEGIIRKTSIKRPRSNPQLNSIAPTPPMPNLDFLPQLKHQPLTKPKPRTSLLPPSPDGGSAGVLPDGRLPDGRTRPSSFQFPVPAAPTIPSSNSTPNILAHRSLPQGSNALTQMNRGSRELATGKRMSIGYMGAKEKELDKPMAKMFVICCNCRFWHDLPSRVYEAMAVPKTLSREKGALLGDLDTLVECPWCQHAMSTGCCAGWTAVCYLHERHH